MKQEHLLMYALVFVLGFVVARMMSGSLVEGDNLKFYEEWEKDDYWCVDTCVNHCTDSSEKDSEECMNNCMRHDRCFMNTNEYTNKYGGKAEVNCEPGIRSTAKTIGHWDGILHKQYQKTLPDYCCKNANLQFAVTCPDLKDVNENFGIETECDELIQKVSCCKGLRDLILFDTDTLTDKQLYDTLVSYKSKNIFQNVDNSLSGVTDDQESTNYINQYKKDKKFADGSTREYIGRLLQYYTPDWQFGESNPDTPGGRYRTCLSKTYGL